MIKKVLKNTKYILLALSLKFVNCYASANTSVSEQVTFWEQVFSHYDDDSTVIHDAANVNLVVDVIDFKIKRFKKYNKDYKRRNELVNKYLDRYKLAISRFKRLKKRAILKGAIEKRIYVVYSNSITNLKKLYSGSVRLRTQTGLARSFRRSARKHSDKIKKIRLIFKRYNLPEVLSYLPFVESMYEIRSHSKSGAKGIWQLMPATARMFGLKVNKKIDERLDFMKSTNTAAKILQQNYQLLKSWPHAITAYNHGTNGMLSAVRLFGRQDFNRTINFYNNNTFGFASKNFYSEFLAAVLAYKKINNKKGEMY